MIVCSTLSLPETQDEKLVIHAVWIKANFRGVMGVNMGPKSDDEIYEQHLSVLYTLVLIFCVGAVSGLYHVIYYMSSIWILVTQCLVQYYGQVNHWHVSVMADTWAHNYSLSILAKDEQYWPFCKQYNTNTILGPWYGNTIQSQYWCNTTKFQSQKNMNFPLNPTTY